MGTQRYSWLDASYGVGRNEECFKTSYLSVPQINNPPIPLLGVTAPEDLKRGLGRCLGHGSQQGCAEWLESRNETDLSTEQQYGDA